MTLNIKTPYWFLCKSGATSFYHNLTLDALKYHVTQYMSVTHADFSFLHKWMKNVYTIYIIIARGFMVNQDDMCTISYISRDLYFGLYFNLTNWCFNFEVWWYIFLLGCVLHTLIWDRCERWIPERLLLSPLTFILFQLPIEEQHTCSHLTDFLFG